jgi:Na+/melibiose symporter-like transporter
MDIISASLLYYTSDVLREVTIFGQAPSGIFVVTPMMVMVGVMFPLVMYLTKKYNKQTAYRTGIPFYIAGGILLAVYNVAWPGWLIPIFTIMMGIGFAGAQIMPWMVFADTIDIAELKFGERNTAVFSGVMTFSRKLANAFAVFMVGWVLDLSGQIPDFTDPVTREVTRFEQPDSVLLAIRLIMGISIVLIMSAAFFFSLKYKVTGPKLIRVRYFLSKAKENEELTPEEQIEKDALLKELA